LHIDLSFAELGAEALQQANLIVAEDDGRLLLGFLQSQQPIVF